MRDGRRIFAVVHDDLDGADGLTGEVLDWSQQGDHGCRLHLALPDDETAVRGVAIGVGIEETRAAQRTAEGFEAVIPCEIERDVDAARALELVEEALSERQPELDSAEMFAFLCNRHDAANAEAGDAAFQADNGFHCRIGHDHGLAEAGQIIAELGRLMHPELGQSRWRMELKLVDAVVRLELGEARSEQLQQRVTIVTCDRVLHRRNGCYHGAHGRRPAGFRINRDCRAS